MKMLAHSSIVNCFDFFFPSFFFFFFFDRKHMCMYVRTYVHTSLNLSNFISFKISLGEHM